MYFEINDPRITYDFSRPFAIDCLHRFDPELVLAFHRERQRFVVLRQCTRRREAWTPSTGKIVTNAPALAYVTDWEDGAHRDDPGPMLEYLAQSDTRRYGKYLEAREQAVLDQRAAVDRSTSDNFQHAYRDNKIQLHRAYAALRDGQVERR